MKRIAAIILVIIIAIPFVGYTGKAEEMLNSKLTIINNNGITTLSLRIWGEGVARERVSLKILRPDVNEEDGTLSLFDKYAFIGQSSVSSDGTFSFEIPFNEGFGEYTGVIIKPSSSQPLKTYISVPSTSRMDEILFKVNGDEFVNSTLDSYLLNYYKELAVDVSLYSQLEENVRFSICDKILTSDYSDFSLLHRAIDESVFFFGISGTEKYELLGKFLAYYEADYLHLSEHPMYSLYEEYEADEQNTVHKMISEASIAEASDINDEFVKAIFTNEVKTVANYKEISGITGSYSDYVSLDLTSYNNLPLDIQDKVLFYVSKGLAKIEDFSGLETLFNTTVSNIYKYIAKENQPSAGGSHGGGGGGGGRGNGGSLKIELDSSATPKLPDMVDKGNEFEEKVTEEVLPDYSGNEIFTDLGSVEWARNAIFELNGKGILSGKEAKRFYPNDNTKRSEFVKMLVMTLGIKDDGAAVFFDDVKTTDWFYPYIKTAYANGIINGTGNNMFSPDNYITRQDAATVIYKAMTLKNYITLAQVDPSSIADYNSIADYAKNAVLMLKSYGVINGYSDGSYKPKQRITRAECAVLLNNIMNLDSIKEANKEKDSETDDLLDVGSIQVSNQFIKQASKPLNEATVYSLESEDVYVGQVRNQNISAAGSEFNTNVIYFDFDIYPVKAEYTEVTKGMVTVVLKLNDTEGYLPENLKMTAYEYDAEGSMKRYPTDQALIGKILDSKLVLSEYDEKLAQGYYKFTFDITEAVNSALKKSDDIMRIAFTLDSANLKELTNEILSGKNTFTGTDFSIGFVLNTAATRKYNGTEIVYGDSQPVLNAYK